MTIGSATNRVSYTGAGTTGPFSVPFYFLENDDLVVIKTTIADGTEATLTLTTDYTVSGAADPDGGSVTLVSSLSSAYKLVIIRDPDRLQSAAYPRNDPFPAATHERVVDKLTMLVQRLRDLVDRSFHLSDGDTSGISLILSNLGASKLIAVNAAGDGLESIDAVAALDVADDIAAAAASAAAAAASYDSFDDRYLGAKSSAPATDNDGNALIVGALYFNSTVGGMFAWNGAAWIGSAMLDDIQNQTATAFTTGGSGTAFTLTPTPAITAYAANQEWDVVFSAACGAAPTFQVSGLASPPNLVQQNVDGTYSNLAAGDFPSGWASKVKMVSATQAWVRTLPDVIRQNIQSAAYTLIMADANKHILHPSADTTARTFTIPANASVPYRIGTALTFVNQNGAGVLTLAINTDTMRLAGAGTTGSRTLAANGIATALKLTETEWIISGTNLT